MFAGHTTCLWTIWTDATGDFQKGHKFSSDAHHLPHWDTTYHTGTFNEHDKSDSCTKIFSQRTTEQANNLDRGLPIAWS